MVYMARGDLVNAGGYGVNVGNGHAIQQDGEFVQLYGTRLKETRSQSWRESALRKREENRWREIDSSEDKEINISIAMDRERSRCVEL